MSIKSMTHTDIYHTLIRNGFREKLDKKGVPTGALVFPHRPIGIKLWGMVDYLKNKHRASQSVARRDTRRDTTLNSRGLLYDN